MGKGVGKRGRGEGGGREGGGEGRGGGEERGSGKGRGEGRFQTCLPALFYIEKRI